MVSRPHTYSLQSSVAARWLLGGFWTSYLKVYKVMASRWFLNLILVENIHLVATKWFLDLIWKILDYPGSIWLQPTSPLYSPDSFHVMQPADKVHEKVRMPIIETQQTFLLVERKTYQSNQASQNQLVPNNLTCRNGIHTLSKVPLGNME